MWKTHKFIMKARLNQGLVQTMYLFNLISEFITEYVKEAWFLCMKLNCAVVCAAEKI